jgi:hypothetical protein
MSEVVCTDVRTPLHESGIETATGMSDQGSVWFPEQELAVVAEAVAQVKVNRTAARVDGHMQQLPGTGLG